MYTQLNLTSCTALTSIFLRMQYRPQTDGLDSDAPVENQLEYITDDHDNGHDANAPADGPADTPAVSTPSATPAPTIFTAEEWRAPRTILSQLPSCMKSVSLDVELEGPPESVAAHLRDVPDWAAIDAALARLPSLERVSVRRLKEHAPFFVQWTKAEHDLLLEKLPVLRERKVLHLHW